MTGGQTTVSKFTIGVYDGIAVRADPNFKVLRGVSSATTTNLGKHGEFPKTEQKQVAIFVQDGEIVVQKRTMRFPGSYPEENDAYTFPEEYTVYFNSLLNVLRVTVEAKEASHPFGWKPINISPEAEARKINEFFGTGNKALDWLNYALASNKRA